MSDDSLKFKSVEEFVEVHNQMMDQLQAERNEIDRELEHHSHHSADGLMLLTVIAIIAAYIWFIVQLALS